MFVGRVAETERLREAILARRSLLVYGPADTGKTALLNQTLTSLPDSARRNCIICDSCESPRSIWRDLVRPLSEAGDPQVTSRVERECGSSGSLEHWLSKQSSLRLRGILRRATRDGSYCIFIDVPGTLPAGAYRLLQEWVWSGRTPVFLLARGATQQELGRVAQLFWYEGLQLKLGPLQPEDAESLLQNSITRFRLRQIADEEFRDFVLTRCNGVPGKIVRLCELASQSAYQSGGHVKLHTLAIDLEMQTLIEPRTSLRANQNG
jgi:Cdc6-like AAA superfamily ATPase